MEGRGRPKRVASVEAEFKEVWHQLDLLKRRVNDVEDSHIGLVASVEKRVKPLREKVEKLFPS